MCMCYAHCLSGSSPVKPRYMFLEKMSFFLFHAVVRTLKLKRQTQHRRAGRAGGTPEPREPPLVGHLHQTQERKKPGKTTVAM